MAGSNMWKKKKKTEEEGRKLGRDCLKKKSFKFLI